MKASVLFVYVAACLTVHWSNALEPIGYIQTYPGSSETVSEEDTWSRTDDTGSDRLKRSGSAAHPFTVLKAALGRSLKNKLAHLGRASASSSAHFSIGSSGGEHETHHYIPEVVHEEHDHKAYQFWSLKSAILNTLLQAVKAIKGGLVALQGNLITKGGQLVVAKGHYLQSKGKAITNLGKNLAASALLVHPHHEHPHIGHAVSSHHDHHSGYGIYYDHPGHDTGPGPEPEVIHYSSHADHGHEHHTEHEHHTGYEHHEGHHAQYLHPTFGYYHHRW